MKKLTKKQQQEHLQELYKRYPYIPAYSRVMGSYPYWTEMQLYAAEAVNAPKECYRIEEAYKGGKNEVYTLSGIQNQHLVDELLYYSQNSKPY